MISFIFNFYWIAITFKSSRTKRREWPRDANARHFLFSARRKSPSFRTFTKDIFLMYHNFYSLPELLWRQNRAYRNVSSVTGGTGTDSKRPHTPVRHWRSGIRNWLHWNTRQRVRSSAKRARHRGMYRMGWVRGKFFLSKNVFFL